VKAREREMAAAAAGVGVEGGQYTVGSREMGVQAGEPGMGREESLG
jgi:hypothetical protein